jgi:hypothetical protein
MSEQEQEGISLSPRDQLMIAIARGQSIAGWARRNNEPESTARRWAADPDLRRQVDDWRRCVLDQALGYMAGHSMWAVRGITALGEKAESESVQLRARRAILQDQIAVSKFSNLEYRMTQIEEILNARTERKGLALDN